MNSIMDVIISVFIVPVVKNFKILSPNLKNYVFVQMTQNVGYSAF